LKHCRKPTDWSRHETAKPKSPVERGELLSLGAYEEVREHFRTRIIQEKKIRRVQVGPRITVVFENHDSVLLQVQEMLRTERITKESAIAHELFTYNELLPGENQLSATMMVEIPEKPEREVFLENARGLEATIRLTVDGEAFPATWDKERESELRLSAVLYLKFPLSAGAVLAIANKTAKTIAISIEHPVYKASASFSSATMAALAEDMRP
jgi:Protein of unknown function (DUF3501)